MQKLRRNTKNLLEDSPSSSEKEDYNVNLEMGHWEFLDDLAENTNSSRNQALREVLDQFMEVVEYEG